MLFKLFTATRVLITTIVLETLSTSQWVATGNFQVALLTRLRYLFLRASEMLCPLTPALRLDYV